MAYTQESKTPRSSGRGNIPKPYLVLTIGLMMSFFAWIGSTRVLDYREQLEFAQSSSAAHGLVQAELYRNVSLIRSLQSLYKVGGAGAALVHLQTSKIEQHYHSINTIAIVSSYDNKVSVLAKLYEANAPVEFSKPQEWNISAATISSRVENIRFSTKDLNRLIIISPLDEEPSASLKSIVTVVALDKVIESAINITADTRITANITAPGRASIVLYPFQKSVPLQVGVESVVLSIGYHPSEAGRILALGILMVGIACSLLVFALAWTLGHKHDKAIALADTTTRSLRTSEAQYQKIVEASHEGILTLDCHGRITFANSRMGMLLGFTPSRLIGHDIVEFAERESEQVFGELLVEVANGQWRQAEIRLRPRGPGDLWVMVSCGPIQEGETTTGLLAMVVDITPRKLAEQRITFLAHHDTLTGLANRNLLRERLNIAIRRAERNGTSVGVLLIDLDRFKTVNDSLGHSTGDALLRDVARRLHHLLREADTVARIGGDEFVAILPDLKTAQGAQRAADKVRMGLGKPYNINTHELHITPSVGVAVYPDHGKDAEVLLMNADTAMYRAKEGGRNVIALFEPEMTASVQRRLQLETDLRRAILNNEFVVHYQPQIDVNSMRIIGQEALVRWRRPDGVLVPPNDFIGLAEDTGLIIDLGLAVLSSACIQNRKWRDAGHRLVVSVNLSPKQFKDPNLLASIQGVLRDTGLEPECLDLEITESSAMDDVAETIRVFKELSAMGVQLSIDDFGTGYSSLSYLRRFPIQRLKVDRSFVQDITSPDGAAITGSVIAIAQQLRLKTVAEGVETVQQLNVLRNQGCQYVQGYYFSKPVEAASFEGLLKTTWLPRERQA